MHTSRFVSAAVFAAFTCAAGADVVIDVTENTVTGTVTFHAHGSLATDQFPAVSHSASQGMGTYRYSMGLSLAPNVTPADRYFFDTPFIVPFCSGSQFGGAFSGPDIFAFDSNGMYADQLYLPYQYASNQAFSSTATFGGSFASMGINGSPIVMNLPGNQTITMSFSSVPTPGAAALLGMCGLASVRRRR